MPSQIYCAIRKSWVTALPEEEIRQRLLMHMTDSLGYSAAHIAVEKELRQLPHLRQESNLPLRRADILVFSDKIRKEGSLWPLLLIECKAVKLTPSVLRQVIGYNYYLKAPYIAVANAEMIQTGWLDPKTQKYQFINHLPSLQALLETMVSTNYS